MTKYLLWTAGIILTVGVFFMFFVGSDEYLNNSIKSKDHNAHSIEQDAEAENQSIASLESLSVADSTAINSKHHAATDRSVRTFSKEAGAMRSASRNQTAEDEFLLDKYAVEMETDGGLLSQEIKRKNSRIEGERRDAAWADVMELEYRNALDRKSPQLEGLRFSSIQCNATICMQTAIGDARNAQHNGRAWNSYISSVVNSEWWKSNFDDMHVLTNIVGGQVLFIAYFERIKK